VTYAALPELRKSQAAAIVNISTGGVIPFIGPLMHYGAAKAALDNWSQALAKELPRERIRVTGNLRSTA
jgi:NAD(P)-dependent dehydrogenase (short-subunit alcohol dehydrogenase family)